MQSSCSIPARAARELDWTCVMIWLKSVSDCKEIPSGSTPGRRIIEQSLGSRLKLWLESK